MEDKNHPLAPLTKARGAAQWSIRKHEQREQQQTYKLMPERYFPRTAKQMAGMQKANTHSRRRATRLPGLHVPFLFMLFQQEGRLQPQDTQDKEVKTLASPLTKNLQRVKLKRFWGEGPRCSNGQHIHGVTALSQNHFVITSPEEPSTQRGGNGWCPSSSMSHANDLAKLFGQKLWAYLVKMKILFPSIQSCFAFSSIHSYT